MKHLSIRNMVLAAMCLALCLVLPFLTGQIPEIGAKLSPMHIPVLLCGFFCGPVFGAIVGFIAPLLRFAIFGMPPFPGCVSMAFELCTYGLITGMLYWLLPKRIIFTYVSLIVAMIAGRVVWGFAQLIVFGIKGTAFTWQAYISGAVLGSVPGIIIHIALIPVIVIALEKAGFLKKYA